MLSVSFVFLVFVSDSLFYLFELLNTWLSLRAVELVMFGLVEVAVDSNLFHVENIVKNLEVHLVSFKFFGD